MDRWITKPLLPKERLLVKERICPYREANSFDNSPLLRRKGIKENGRDASHEAVYVYIVIIHVSLTL